MYPSHRAQHRAAALALREQLGRRPTGDEYQQTRKTVAADRRRTERDDPWARTRTRTQRRAAVLARRARRATVSSFTGLVRAAVRPTR
jgi:hypothetical protein